MVSFDYAEPFSPLNSQCTCSLCEEIPYTLYPSTRTPIRLRPMLNQCRNARILSYLRCRNCCSRKLIVEFICRLHPGSPFEYPSPPHRGVERTRTIMQWGIHIREEVPHVPNNNTHDLILWDRSVQYQTEPHQYPRQVRRREDQQAEEA